MVAPEVTGSGRVLFLFLLMLKFLRLFIVLGKVQLKGGFAAFLCSCAAGAFSEKCSHVWQLPPRSQSTLSPRVHVGVEAAERSSLWPKGQALLLPVSGPSPNESVRTLTTVGPMPCHSGFSQVPLVRTWGARRPFPRHPAQPLPGEGLARGLAYRFHVEQMVACWFNTHNVLINRCVLVHGTGDALGFAESCDLRLF